MAHRAIALAEGFGGSTPETERMCHGGFLSQGGPSCGGGMAREVAQTPFRSVAACVFLRCVTVLGGCLTAVAHDSTTFQRSSPGHRFVRAPSPGFHGGQPGYTPAGREPHIQSRPVARNADYANEDLGGKGSGAGLSPAGIRIMLMARNWSAQITGWAAVLTRGTVAGAVQMLWQARPARCWGRSDFGHSSLRTWQVACPDVDPAPDAVAIPAP